MTDPIIQCPRCRNEIKLTESLAAPIVESTRRQFEERSRKERAEIAAREAMLLKEKDALEQARRAVDEQVRCKLVDERRKIAIEEEKRLKLAMSLDLERRDRELCDLKQILRTQTEKLTEAQKTQAELLRKQRELDDARRELELTIERNVQEKLLVERQRARKEVEDELKLKVMEKEQTITAMQAQIEELKRRSEQSSSNTVGEVLEVKLEALLREKFPRDQIEPVARGERGGDVLHRVLTPLGHVAGTILWESKRTKRFEDGWLPKLRDDQRAARADLAVIVTASMPRGIENFDLCDGVWVSDVRCAMAIAMILRQSLLEIAAARQAGEGQKTKVEMMYHYLTGPRFRQRVAAIVEKFTDMRDDLDKEKKFLHKQWAARSAQIDSVIESTAGMYGDLQGIAGKSLAEIEGLDVKLLESDDDEPAQLFGAKSGNNQQ